jgi:hypothetical protein
VLGGRQLPISDWMVCVCLRQPRHNYGDFAAVCVGARAPGAVDVAIAAGFVKEQVEASEIGDPRTERLTGHRGGTGVLNSILMHCEGEMLMSLRGESHASKLRAWQTAAAGCMVESLLAHHNGLSL